jgi:SAM-dependent methyltransferase
MNKGTTPQIRKVSNDNCSICQKKGYYLYRNIIDNRNVSLGKWNIMHCEKCDFAWLNPAPDDSEIDKVYVSYPTHNPTPVKAGKNIYQYMKESILGTSYGYPELVTNKKEIWVGRLLGLFPILNMRSGYSIKYLSGNARGKLLEIGSGNGFFLNKMKMLGWEVQGIEPDKKAATISEAQYDIRVHHNTLDKASILDDTFDAIVMHHVIEHISNPIEILAECYRILKPNGKIVIITPNLESLGHRLFRAHWRGLEPPRHLKLFAMKSINQCLERVGLSPISAISYTGYAAPMFRESLNDLLFKQANKVKSALYVLAPVFYLTECILNLVFKNLGEELVIVSQKNNENSIF